MDSAVLTANGTQEYSMEEEMLWYLSGAVDSTAHFSLKVQKDTRYKFDYQIYPRIKISRIEPRTTLFGLLDEYCEEALVKYHTTTSGSSHEFNIENPESIERFLEPIIGGFIQQQGPAESLLNEIVPVFKDGGVDSEQEFIEVVSVAQNNGLISSRAKYDLQHFENEWGISAE